MSTPIVEDGTAAVPRQRFWMAYYAALITVLYLKGLEAILTPDGLAAALWRKPLALVFPLLLSSFVLAPVALLNVMVFVRPWEKMRAARWRTPATWALWIGYGAVILYAAYHLTASGGLRGVLLGLVSLPALTALNYRFQQAAHPHLLLIGLAVITAVIPAFLYLRPVAHLSPDAPIIWVATDFNEATRPSTAAQLYWQYNQAVFLQWKGKNYRLDGMSPAFAFRQHAVLTLEGRDLVVTPLAGTPRRISLKPYIPNYQSILTMQPTRDGVLLNIYDSGASRYRVVRVNLPTDTVQPVPHALRVRAAETTDRYVVRWSVEWPHQVRDGHDRVLRQHGLYPWRFHEWDADLVDYLFALSSRSDVTLIGPDSLSMSTIDPGFAIGSITLQPGRHQLWITEDLRDHYPFDLHPSRLLIYSYDGRCLGQRMLTGEEVLRAMPVDESMAQYLIRRYSSLTHFQSVHTGTLDVVERQVLQSHSYCSRT